MLACAKKALLEASPVLLQCFLKCVPFARNEIGQRGSVVVAFLVAIYFRTVAA